MCNFDYSIKNLQYYTRRLESIPTKSISSFDHLLYFVIRYRKYYYLVIDDVKNGLGEFWFEMSHIVIEI